MLLLLSYYLCLLVFSALASSILQISLFLWGYFNYFYEPVLVQYYVIMVESVYVDPLGEGHMLWLNPVMEYHFTKSTKSWTPLNIWIYAWKQLL